MDSRDVRRASLLSLTLLAGCGDVYGPTYDAVDRRLSDDETKKVEVLVGEAIGSGVARIDENAYTVWSRLSYGNGCFVEVSDDPVDPGFGVGDDVVFSCPGASPLRVKWRAPDGRLWEAQSGFEERVRRGQEGGLFEAEAARVAREYRAERIDDVYRDVFSR